MNILSMTKNKDLPPIERRTQKRIYTSIHARFFYSNLFYSGNVINISERGMFISTKRFIPSDSMFVVLIRGEDALYKVVARVKRIARDTGGNDGIGVELMSPSAGYLSFVNRLKNEA